ncbi:hypothetical protein MYSTI_02563 [Myxococcus stipitatus DSM 14675]|uniref:Uncharacterized protein n=1 Tax=Myxococcus stipitatus (strain DSM 14675 / JCM 12634 / Mx s8) TaxID=1278073 RepID=L7UBN2_MYXSD|nr:polymer-forming cytoskeletal protein [Myxococcus stipitatus]AGC43879.1 hypothetical protein MYSTI_02563 [Myxococcus stipitatus DSM 14675]
MTAPTGKELSSKLKSPPAALTKNRLLKKLEGESLLSSLAKDLKKAAGASASELVEGLTHPVSAYPLALLLRDAATEAPSSKRIKKLDVTESRLVTGDLHVEGKLIVDSTLVVLGNVEARTVLVGEGGTLVVGGHLQACVAGGEGWLLVNGDLEADLVCCAYEAGELGVNGTLRALLAVSSNHGVRIVKNEASNFFDLWDPSPKSKKYQELLSHVSPKAVLPEDEDADFGVLQVDFHKLMKLALSGKPFLQG